MSTQVPHSVSSRRDRFSFFKPKYLLLLLLLLLLGPRHTQPSTYTNVTAAW